MPCSANSASFLPRRTRLPCLLPVARTSATSLALYEPVSPASSRGTEGANDYTRKNQATAARTQRPLRKEHTGILRPMTKKKRIVKKEAASPLCGEKWKANQKSACFFRRHSLRSLTLEALSLHGFFHKKSLMWVRRLLLFSSSPRNDHFLLLRLVQHTHHPLSTRASVSPVSSSGYTTVLCIFEKPHSVFPSGKSFTHVD